jgi:hypothetical protein
MEQEIKNRDRMFKRGIELRIFGISGIILPHDCDAVHVKFTCIEVGFCSWTRHIRIGSYLLKQAEESNLSGTGTVKL